MLKNILFCSFTPLLTGSKTPPQNSARAKKLVLGATVRKSPIGVG
ncbi:spermidine/putrescine ABC transporter ATP-binding protein [Bacillus paranthracis]|nr:spermidine/putrescine ABC transporter ATP-binding protein [Bacillus paranthracis]